MSYLYKTKGTCSTLIEVELDGHVVKDVKFTGGCNGNLKAYPETCAGADRRAGRGKTFRHLMFRTSDRPCGDQLAKACRAAFRGSERIRITLPH